MNALFGNIKLGDCDGVKKPEWISAINMSQCELIKPFVHLYISALDESFAPKCSCFKIHQCLF